MATTMGLHMVMGIRVDAGETMIAWPDQVKEYPTKTQPKTASHNEREHRAEQSTYRDHQPLVPDRNLGHAECPGRLGHS